MAGSQKVGCCPDESGDVAAEIDEIPAQKEESFTK
jgi:hypothetical protein